MRAFTPRRAVVSADVYRAIEAEVERLIAILDLLAPNPDCEPSLGWTNTEVWWGEYPPHRDGCHAGDDREADYVRRDARYGRISATADDEPLCGSVHCHGNVSEAVRYCDPWDQEFWAQGCGEVENECEIVSEDEGAQCDDEGALWPT